MRRFAYVTIGGITSIVILKFLILPFFAMMMGAMASAVKVALVVGAVALIWCICKQCCKREADSCC